MREVEEQGRTRKSEGKGKGNGASEEARVQGRREEVG